MNMTDGQRRAIRFNGRLVLAMGVVMILGAVVRAETKWELVGVVAVGVFCIASGIWAASLTCD